MRVLKWVGIVLGGLVVVALVAVAGLYFMGESRWNKVYSIQPAAVALPSGPAALERGRHLASSHCAGCHGENLGGTPFFSDPGLGNIPAGNLTAGRGGIGKAYADADWVRAIRHSVSQQGKGLVIMPSAAFYWLSDEDLGAIIAYVKQVPPVDGDMGVSSVSPLAKILFQVGAFGNAIAAETLPHSAPRAPAPAVGVTAAYGEYLVKTGDCHACHGAALTGAQPPEPGAPYAPNLTQSGGMRSWTEASFISTMRTRDSKFMPFKYIGRLSDDELKAMWLYLKSLPK